MNKTNTYIRNKQMRRHVSQYSSKFDYDYTAFTNTVYTLMQIVILIIKPNRCTNFSNLFLE